MQRLTARLLLLFALAGTFLPVVLQATAAPSHACCVRKSVPLCPDARNGEEPVASAPGCCNGNQRQAVTRTGNAHPAPSQTDALVHEISSSEPDPRSVNPGTLIVSSHSTRAPPRTSIA